MNSKRWVLDNSHELLGQGSLQLLFQGWARAHIGTHRTIASWV